MVLEGDLAWQQTRIIPLGGCTRWQGRGSAWFRWSDCGSSYFIELNYTWMAYYLQDVHLPRDSLHIRHFVYLRLQNYFDRNLLARRKVDRLLYNPKSTSPHRLLELVVANLIVVVILFGSLTVHIVIKWNRDRYGHRSSKINSRKISK